MNTCYFCGPTEAELTKEELWPKWFSKFLKEVGVKRLDARRVLNRKVISSWRAFRVDACLSGVCKQCNNEVLSTLENKYFKPLLRKMALTAPVHLSIADQATLIAWITRFAMVADLIHLDGATPFFRPEERKHFIDTFLPPDDSYIWLSAIQSTHAAGQSFTRLHFSDGSTRVAVCTGVIARTAFQFLLPRWHEPRPSDATIRDGMRRNIANFECVAIQIFPAVEDTVRWPASAYLVSETFKPFADRWGGDCTPLPS